MQILNGFKIFMGQFELIMGLIVLVGLLVQKKGAGDVIKGVVKAIVGVMILKQGSTLLQSAYRPVMNILSKAFNITGVVTENYAGMAAINSNLVETVLSVIPIVMLVGFLINLAFARFTPLKYVFLSGHTMLAFSTLVVWLFYWFFKVEGVMLVLASGLFCGMYWTVMPAWVHRYAKPFVGNDFTLGHISGTSAVFSTWVGKLMGGYNKKTNPKIHDEDEDTMQFKGFATIFNDSTVVTCLLMTVVLGGIALIAGKDYIVEQQQIANITSNWVVYTLELGASFTVGIVVLLTGVRMMIAELVPAFKGISDKLIPNSVPGLDMPIFFPLAPLSSILGFIGAFVGEFVGFAILLAVGSPILMIPGIIATFFDGGIAGVFGYKYGGRKAALVSGVVVGLIQILGGVFFTNVSGLAGLGATYGNTDFGSIWIVISGVMNAVRNIWVFLPILIAAFVAAIFLLRPKAEKKAV
ncbi:MAG: PTS ascorbate transporter subunit IIC [Clostridiales bacterium]|nr:PTS ascorbate transporter subunit IIC [Clostridiales bacterium]